jgi:hypothetical protein
MRGSRGRPANDVDGPTTDRARREATRETDGGEDVDLDDTDTDTDPAPSAEFDPIPTKEGKDVVGELARHEASIRLELRPGRPEEKTPTIEEITRRRLPSAEPALPGRAGTARRATPEAQGQRVRRRAASHARRAAGRLRRPAAAAGAAARR